MTLEAVMFILAFVGLTLACVLSLAVLGVLVVLALSLCKKGEPVEQLNVQNCEYNV